MWSFVEINGLKWYKLVQNFDMALKSLFSSFLEVF